jgi:hypothetical protein
MTETEIVQAYVRYFLEGADSSAWAVEELSELASDDPERAWQIILWINATSVEDEAWLVPLSSAIGCGVLEDLIVLHEATMLPIIMQAAKEDAILRLELSTIREFGKSLCLGAIKAVLGRYGSTRNA